MSEESNSVIHIEGTIPPEEWKAFFKKHFTPLPKGSKHPVEAKAKTTGSCEDYGCPHTHPISGGPITGCEVTITGGRVVSVSCHYALKRA
jgi:hypothetical protein